MFQVQALSSVFTIIYLMKQFLKNLENRKQMEESLIEAAIQI